MKTNEASSQPEEAFPDEAPTRATPDREQALVTATLLDAWIPLFTQIEMRDLKNLIGTLQREETILPITNPTAYMRTANDRSDRLKVYNAALKFLGVIHEVADEAERRGGLRNAWRS